MEDLKLLTLCMREWAADKSKIWGSYSFQITEDFLKKNTADND